VRRTSRAGGPAAWREPQAGARRRARYVQTAPSGLEGWSPAAVAVGKHIVETSAHALAVDPMVTLEDLTAELDIAADDLRIALLDLKDGGYLRELNVSGHYAPQPALFVDFDEAFMPFSPSEDARTLANRMVTGEERAADTKRLAETLGWEPRRMNSAICYLERAGRSNRGTRWPPLPGGPCSSCAPTRRCASRAAMAEPGWFVPSGADQRDRCGSRRSRRPPARRSAARRRGRAGLVDNTIRAFLSDLKIWDQWCRRRGLATARADAEAVAAYLRALSGSNRIRAIR
jgi:hypothetical protein